MIKTTLEMRERYATLYAYFHERYPYEANFEAGRREFDEWLALYDAGYMTKSSRSNKILQDAREYRAARLRMNNPKGWAIVRDVSARAGVADMYKGEDPEKVRIAFKVLARLARISPNR